MKSNAQRIKENREKHGMSYEFSGIEYRETNESIDNITWVTQDEIDEAINEYREELESGLKTLCLPEYRKVFDGSFGAELFSRSAKDFCGEISRRFFNMSDYYVTADQLFSRFTKFSYDNDIDVLQSEQLRKSVYNYIDYEAKFGESEVQRIAKDNIASQQKVFTEPRSGSKAETKYRNSQVKNIREVDGVGHGELQDELTGNIVNTTTKPYNKKDWYSNGLQADHIMPWAVATYNAKYISQDKISVLQDFYNSNDNFMMIHASANSSKKDVRVCLVNGKTEFLTSSEISSRKKDNPSIEIVDITSRASAKEMAEAIISKWEKETPSGDKIAKLKEQGYLDENGKVKPDIKDKLIAEINAMHNKESWTVFKTMDKKIVAHEAFSATKNALSKIIKGQVLYYGVPPVLYEMKVILKNKYNGVKEIIADVRDAVKRAINYIYSKLSTILANILDSSAKKFIKTFFDIIIDMMKSTVKKFFRIVKQVVLSLVDAVKIMFDSSKSSAQKKDAITKLFAVSMTTLLLEFFFEALEIAGAPEILMETLQIVATVFATNLVLLFLERGDFFSVNNGSGKEELVTNVELMVSSSLSTQFAY